MSTDSAAVAGASGGTAQRRRRCGRRSPERRLTAFGRGPARVLRPPDQDGCFGGEKEASNQNHVL